MTNKPSLLIIAFIILFGGLILGSSSLFIVEQPQQALVLQFGELRKVHTTPGLKMKLPFIQEVVFYDKRLLNYEISAYEVTARDQKRLVVDVYTLFKINDPLLFYKSIRLEGGAKERLSSIITGSLNSVIGNVRLSQLISHERSSIMRLILKEVNTSASRLGIETLDVRIRRADLPKENSAAIFARMKSERDREAKEIRAKGEEMAQGIRSRAEKERTILLAEATKKAQILKGEGDAESIKLYAAALNRDPKFYSFYRAMEAYRKGLPTKDSTLVLSPKGDFFHYFNSMRGQMHTK